MAFKISRSQRLIAVISISSAFFFAEISVGFYTHSLALVADAFHYLTDLVGFIVALVALRVSESRDCPKTLSFGWQRAQLLGAFFNGVLLFALGISVFLQSIERFVTLHYVEDPKLMFVMGAIGLGLNLLSAIFLHEHHHHGPGHAHSSAPETPLPIAEGIQEDGIAHPQHHQDHRHTTSHAHAHAHAHGHDLGTMGVLLHVLGDAANNLGVMAAALVIWLATYEGRFYADPGTVRQAGLILLESTPNGLDPTDVKHDLEKIPGILAVHELHIWRLNQQKTMASVHLVIADELGPNFKGLTRVVNECFHAYGIHSATLQPEFEEEAVTPSGEKAEVRCKAMCGTVCEELTCCG
ncbi:hypothetical protein FE257_002112 [Aspergillus nanangensis]|uniref:Cation diffusion facilitator family metal ion transporter n=1 Tax=Aspergillus nanangensis TaxID=2582783 RepID=A0AAD4CTC5_ASPNN|nr:hypothetical protein FE257_002112 [Aspergillus nanangensis]